VFGSHDERISRRGHRFDEGSDGEADYFRMGDGPEVS
jgi:hypothetical protein